MTMEDRTIMVIVAIILTTAVVANVNDKYKEDKTIKVVDEVKVFVSKGGRNTAQQGFDLCKRINKLERRHKIKQVTGQDCFEIYSKEMSKRK